MGDVVLEDEEDAIDVFEIKEEKNQFLLNVYGLVSTGLMVTMFAIFASYGTTKSKCLLKVLCWEVCFPTPPSKYMLKYFPIVFFAFAVSTGAVVMAYIATALQNYENLFNILVMASLTIIVGYAIPVTAKKLNSKDWAKILRYTNVFFATLYSIDMMWIIFLPIIHKAKGKNKTFFVITFIIYLLICLLQVVEYVLVYVLSKKKNKIKDTYCTDAIMVYGSFVYLYSFLIISHPFYNLRWW